MPMYSFACEICGHADSEFKQMKDATPVGNFIQCPNCGHPNYRRQLDLAHTDLKEFHKPIEMQSVACNSWEEIREIQDKCPDADISDDPNDELFGVPIARTRKAKMQVLRAVGYRENN